ncbi:MAG: response regulator transcription factor [Acholeplasmatales bacterium]|nr:response regulator transcription factor [Acholeplasmatales bacterium]
MKNSILIIEDDIKINNLIMNLLKEEYTIYQAFNAKDGLSLVYANNVDVIILDLGLPDIDGIEVIKDVRRHTTKPVVVVSARSFESDIVTALDLGADDYLVKPFRDNELKSRIKTAIRHSISNNILDADMIFKYRNIRINFNTASVYVNNNLVNVTTNEYKIIALLAKNAGRVLTYDYIIRTIWGPYANESTSSLRVHMANIRRKIEINPADPKFIVTSIGIGYRFNID